MPEERACTFCGRVNPAEQPRCMGCGQRASGAVLLTESSPPTAVSAVTPWWQASTNGSHIPTPPQVREQIDRLEAEKLAAEQRATEDARRREETSRRVAEARDRLAAKQAERQAVAETAALRSCARCGVPLDEGFSFCLRCGAEDAVEPAAASGSFNVNEKTIRPTQSNTSKSAVQSAIQPVQQVKVAVSPPRVASSSVTPGVPAILSFFMPGVGQMLNGQVAKGALLMLVAFAATVVFHLPSMGLMMVIGRVVAAVDSYRIAERRRNGSPVRDGEWDLG